MIDMVAFCQNAEYLLETSPRARGQSRSIGSGASNCVRLRVGNDLRSTARKMHLRLESCSRDPIGYQGGINFYRTIAIGLDPTGLRVDIFLLPNSEIGIPWSDQDLGISESGEPVLGITLTRVKVNCHCDGCPDNKKGCAQLHCMIAIYQHVFIDVDEINKNRPPFSVDNAYGHEQQHVLHNIKASLLEANLQRDIVDARGCESWESCRVAAPIFQESIRRNLVATIKLHGHTGGFPYPNVGEPVEPYGEVPEQTTAPDWVQEDSATWEPAWEDMPW